MIKFDRRDNKYFFNDIESAIDIGRMHISPFIGNDLYVYLEDKDILIHIDYFDLLEILNSTKMYKVDINKRNTRYDKIGIIINQNYLGGVNISTIIDWGTQKIVSSVNNEKIRLDHGPDCEYNDCIYIALFNFLNELYYLKIRITETDIQTSLFRVDLLNFVNEMIFYELRQKFKLI
ncbi:hypothetical protein [Acidianus sp. HS-5]|uniref:hypothetical protein n=1 Tax=Acidianus sp. HS-5 TaxID=2886040 RepID=UPI001F486C69|nr:hypothetical protein [Acidianus sp. HS-5]BDC17153.1 hypothetical protein HS5_00430 [Acidianus sp. HS-5]